MPAHDNRASDALGGAAIDPFALRPSPPGGRQRMPLEQRAKIFIPFDPLEGFSDALRSAELRVEMEKRAQDEHPVGDGFDD